MPRFKRAVLAVIPMMAPFSAQAQTTAPSLQDVINTPQYQKNITALFASLPVDVFQRCPALVSEASTVTIIEPPSFASDGNPTAGLWKESFPVSGCGNDTSINFFFKARPDETITSLIAAPGDTHAGPLLQWDTQKYVMLAVQAKATDCAALHVRNTSYDGPVAPEPNAPEPNAPISNAINQAAAGWRETWTVSACGQVWRVPVTFTLPAASAPDTTGTHITTAPAIMVSAETKPG